MKNYFQIIILASIVFFTSCEKDTQLSLKKGEAQLSVDAYLTNQPGEQLIKLRLTSAYLDNEDQPRVSGAIVTLSVPDSIIDLYKAFLPPNLQFLAEPLIFKEVGKSGDYKYTLPSGFDTLPIFRTIPYELSINYDGETFKAISFKDNVPNVDSLTYEFRKQRINGTDTVKEGYIVTDMNCVDLKGKNTCYWIKSFRNGIFFNKPTEMNLSYDGAFAPGSDGLNFIVPLAFNITPERLNVNDKLRVELHSIGVPTFYYLNLAANQMNNTGLFATPPVNVFTNFENSNKTSKAKAVGFFTLASVSIKEIIIENSPENKLTR